MSWGRWTMVGLALALTGVLTGAMYVAATSDFDAPPPVSAAALPTPSEQARSVAPINGLAAGRAASAAATTPGKTGAGRTQKRTAGKPRTTASGTSKSHPAKSTATKAKPKTVKAGGSKPKRTKVSGKK